MEAVQIDPEMIIRHHLSRSRASTPPTLEDKRVTWKAVCLASGSLPVMTIATRDRLEAVMQAQKRADENRMAMSGAAISPETLDG